MAEPKTTGAAAFESPVTTRYPTNNRAVSLFDQSHLAKLVVRAQPGGAVGDHLGVAFGTSTRVDQVLVCGQRPGEWVLIGAADACANVAVGIDRSGHVSVVDLTHGRALFRLSGAPASAALEKLCSLDLTDAMTPDGAVTSASIAKVSCDIVRDDEADRPSYLISCDRSFGQYLFDVLIDALQEWTSPAPPQGTNSTPSTST